MSDDAGKWREIWAGNVCSPEDMADFVDSAGCCTSTALPAYPDFPSQEEAMGTVRPGSPDPWFWKDDLHIEKRLYYTRVFGGKPGFVANALLPAFMAANGAVADELIFNGEMSPSAQQVYHAIEAHGPIAIRDLKRSLTPDAKQNADRILIDLDRRFLITKIDITGRTRGTYGYVWDLVERWMPEMLDAADSLGRKQAESILREHFSNFGIAPDSKFYSKILGWKD